MAIVGQINASPSISIAFKTLATTAIQRSERGTVCLILKDKKATGKWYTFKTIADVETKNWDAESIKYINLAMHYGAFKVLVRVVQNEESTDKVLKDLEMRKFNYPVVFDVTHAVQKPGGLGTATSGDREYVYPLLRAGLAIGVDAIFAEVHPNPAEAKSDGPNMLYLKDLEEILKTAIEIDKIVKGV